MRRRCRGAKALGVGKVVDEIRIDVVAIVQGRNQVIWLQIDRIAQLKRQILAQRHADLQIGRRSVVLP